MADTVAYPGFQTWWATRKHWHTDEFRTLIDRHIQTAKPTIYDGYLSSAFRFTPTAQTNLLTLTARLGVRWCEGVIEHVIGHATTERDSLRFVKGPMNAKINSALTVFLLGLRQIRKTAR